MIWHEKLKQNYSDYLGRISCFNENYNYGNIFSVEKKFLLNENELTIDKIYNGDDEFSVLYRLKNLNPLLNKIEDAFLIYRENNKWVIDMKRYSFLSVCLPDEQKVLTFDPLPHNADEVILVVAGFRADEFRGIFFGISGNSAIPDNSSKILPCLFPAIMVKHIFCTIFHAKPIFLSLTNRHNRKVSKLNINFLKELFDYFEKDQDDYYHPALLTPESVFNILADSLQQPGTEYVPEIAPEYRSQSVKISQLLSKGGNFYQEMADMMLHIKTMAHFPVNNPENFILTSNNSHFIVFQGAESFSYPYGTEKEEEKTKEELMETYKPVEYGSPESKKRNKEIYKNLKCKVRGIPESYTFRGMGDPEEYYRDMMEMGYPFESILAMEVFSRRNAQFYRHWLQVCKKHGFVE
jgi:hypothetical protein